MKIGLITANAKVLDTYFPTKEEPELRSTEPPFTPDDQLLVNHLRKVYGFVVDAVIWGCEVNGLKHYDAFIIRSPWDYMDNSQKREAFFQWLKELDRLKIPIFNDLKILNWLLDKHYLKDFSQAGINIVPTQFIEKGQAIDLDEVYKKKGPFIIKPCISAAGIGLRYISSSEIARHQQASIEEELQTVGFMIQDFLGDIKTNGEWSLIFFEGEYSHSVLKKPAEDNILVQGEYGGTLTFSQAPEDIISFGKNVISSIKEAYKNYAPTEICKETLYLRVDIINSGSKYYLSELEGVEPELFFRAKKGSEELFADRFIQLFKKARN